MKAGKWQHPQFGEIEITPADLHQFKENFDKRVRGTDIAVDISHQPDKGAVGWFKELRVDGDKLMAKVAWTEEGANLIKSGKYRYFSPEFMFQWKDPESGQVYKDVLFGGALTNRPFLKNMDPIEFSETLDPIYGEIGVVWFSEDDANNSEDDDDRFDPDGDGDDDSTADPEKNPDWESDVRKGYLPWHKLSKAQQQQLTKSGFTKADADRARAQWKNHQKMSEPDSEQAKAKAAQEARSKKYGIGIKENGSVTKPSEYANVPDDDFADPVNYAYPVDPDHVMAAYRYFAKAKNQQVYTPAERKIVAQRIIDHLPDKYKDEAKKVFKFEDPDQTGTKNLNPDDGSSSEHPIEDEDAGKFSETQNKNQSHGGGNMTVSMEEYQKALDRIQQLEAEHRRMKMSEKVREFVKAGKVVPAQQEKLVDLLVGMNEEQVAKFSEVIEASPAVVKFSEETGFGGDPGTPQNPEDLLAELTEKYIKEGKNHREAAALAFSELESRGIKLDSI